MASICAITGLARRARILVAILGGVVAGCALPPGKAAQPTLAPPELNAMLVGQLKCAGTNWKGCLRIVVVNVGQGSSTVVKLPSGDAVLIDAGGSGTDEKQHLQSAVTREIGSSGKFYAVVLTHRDFDHVKWIGDIPQAQSPRFIHISGNSGSHRDEVKDYFNTIFGSRTPACNAVSAGGSKLLCYDKDFSEQVCNTNLAPRDTVTEQCMSVYAANTGDAVSAGNAQSVVVGMAVMHPGTTSFVRALVMGDGEGATQDLIKTKVAADNIESSVLVMGHHGSNTNGSNSLDWLQAVSAQVYIASNKDNAGYVHPRREVIDTIFGDTNLKARLATADSHQFTAGDKGELDKFCNLQFTNTIYSTFNGGDIVIEADGLSWTVVPQAKLTNAYLPCK